ncbi:MAG TPA: cupin domain-containing protein [Ignavibacteriaceae bacterium]|nr:cupin domain-containing protein [Ignavibacteriaceae bacterium]
MTDKISIKNAEHYNWGKNCDGSHLLNNKNLSVIQEKVPPGKSEVKHFHSILHQFFFILEGEGTIEIENKEVILQKNKGLEIPSGIPHKFRNNSKKDVIFLVITSPKSHGDRIGCE